MNFTPSSAISSIALFAQSFGLFLCPSICVNQFSKVRENNEFRSSSSVMSGWLALEEPVFKSFHSWRKVASTSVLVVVALEAAALLSLRALAAGLAARLGGA